MNSLENNFPLTHPEISEMLRRILEEIREKSIFLQNISKSVLEALFAFVSDHCNWVRLIKANNQRLTSSIIGVLSEFLKILTDLSESNYLAINESMPHVLASLQSDLFTLLLSKALSSTDTPPNSTAENLLNQIKSEYLQSFNPNFNNLLLYYYLLLQKETTWKSSYSIETTKYFNILSNYLEHFLPKGLHQNYISEITESLKIGHSIIPEVSESLLALHLTSVSHLFTCINKNNEYFQISDSLNSYNLTIEQLSNHDSQFTSSPYLILTDCPSQENINKKLFLSTKQSPHHLKNLTIIGSQTSTSFNFDFSIPSMKPGTCLCYIFPFHSNYYLVDVSGQVKVKLDQNLSYQLVENHILFLGRKHEFIIKFSEYLKEGRLLKSLKLLGFPDCELTKNLEPIEFPLSPDSQSIFLIGRTNDCSLFIPHPEISKRHAVIFYEKSSERWFIRDQSSNGCYFKLKTWAGPGEESLPGPFELKDNSVFQVESSMFLFRT
jgi:hypothetical protein